MGAFGKAEGAKTITFTAGYRYSYFIYYNSKCFVVSN